MADTSAIPANLDELIASRARFDGAPNVPQTAWTELRFPNENGGVVNLLQIPQQGTLGVIFEADNVQRVYYWREGGETQDLQREQEYTLSVNPGDAIICEYAEGAKANFKMAWWFK